MTNRVRPGRGWEKTGEKQVKIAATTHMLAGIKNW